MDNSLDFLPLLDNQIFLIVVMLHYNESLELLIILKKAQNLM